MKPEEKYGNIEYKTKLVDISADKVEAVATQMRYRCDEGGGEAIYVIGVGDKGDKIGLTEEEFEETYSNLKDSALRNGR